MFGGALAWEVDLQAGFDEAGRFVRPDDMDRAVLISSDTGRHAAWLAEYAELGFDGLFLHHVGQDQQRFIEAFGERASDPFRTDVTKAWPEEALEGSFVPLGRLGDPAEVAPLALHLASAASSYTTGAVIRVDGGITRKV